MKEKNDKRSEIYNKSMRDLEEKKNRINGKLKKAEDNHNKQMAENYYKLSLQRERRNLLDYIKVKCD